MFGFLPSDEKQMGQVPSAFKVIQSDLLYHLSSLIIRSFYSDNFYLFISSFMICEFLYLHFRFTMMLKVILMQSKTFLL